MESFPYIPTVSTALGEFMKCYNHNDSDAIGICSNCSKALCIECISIATEFISCKGDCENEVKIRKNYVRANIERFNKNNKQSQNEETCIFCNLPRAEVEFLIAGESGLSICEQCIDLAQQHVDWARFQKKPKIIRKLLHFANKIPPVGFGRPYKSK